MSFNEFVFDVARLSKSGLDNSYKFFGEITTSNLQGLSGLETFSRAKQKTACAKEIFQSETKRLVSKMGCIIKKFRNTDESLLFKDQHPLKTLK